MGCTPSSTSPGSSGRKADADTVEPELTYRRTQQGSSRANTSSTTPQEVRSVSAEASGKSEARRGSSLRSKGRGSSASSTQHVTFDLPAPLNRTSSHRSSLRQLQFDAMQLKKKMMSVLFVFFEDNHLEENFIWAASAGAYTHEVVRSHKSAEHVYIDKQHDLVIIDARSSLQEAQDICRSIRKAERGEHSVIVAITSKCEEGEEASISPLLEAGFNRRLPAHLSRTECLNELMILEHNDVRTQAQLYASRAFIVAAERSSEPVDIVSDDLEYQYVNPAFEKLLGYSREELLGKDAKPVTLAALADRRGSHPESQSNRVWKGRAWEGLTFVKTKSGEVLGPIQGSMTPIYGPNNRIQHWVSVRKIEQCLLANGSEKSNDLAHINGAIPYHSIRRESLARLHSMNIEAPITKVISMVSAAQENSPTPVAQALDRVLDILRSTELYSPYISPNVKDDKMTQDYVGGLLTSGPTSRSSTSEAFSRAGSQVPGAGNQSLKALKPADAPADIQQLIEKEASWDFDVIQLERLSNKRVMEYLCFKTFQRFRVCEYLSISEQTLINWLHMIQANYHVQNPYHNATHASDVMQATAYFLSRNKMKLVMDQTDEVAALIAAVIHDLDHPGRTNPFLVNTDHQLALLYNDQAVLESHHVSLAYRLTIKDENVNIFKNLERDDYRQLRKQVVDMVLATEMAKHFEHLNKFISGINNMASPEDSETNGHDSPESAGLISKLSHPENKTLIKRMIIKCADVSNPVRPLPLCIEWAKRISEEYFAQTDDEKEKQLPVVMPQFDRHTCNMPKSQIGFTDLFIKDMFEALHGFCDVGELIDNMEKNYDYWQSRIEAGGEEHQTS